MENWEKEFDEKFVESDVYLSPTDYNEQLLIIKSFISQLLAQKEKEIREKLKKEIEEKISKMKKPDVWEYTGWDTPEINISKDEFRQQGIDGYNEAILNILNLLKVKSK